MSYEDCYLRDQLRSLEVTIQENAPTLRERLICAALTGILANPRIDPMLLPDQSDRHNHAAIQHADLVLEVLARHKEASTIPAHVT